MIDIDFYSTAPATGIEQHFHLTNVSWRKESLKKRNYLTMHFLHLSILLYGGPAVFTIFLTIPKKLLFLSVPVIY